MARGLQTLVIMRDRAIRHLTNAISVIVIGVAGMAMIPSCGADPEQSESASIGESRDLLVATLQAELYAPDPFAAQQFGNRVAIDGDTAVLASNYGAYVYTRSAGSWTMQQKINDHYGSYDAIALQGDTLIIGDPFDDEKATDAGAVRVYTRNGTTWSQQAKLTVTNASNWANFGRALALDGDTLIVAGRPQDCSGGGKIYIFVRNGTTWTEQQQQIWPSVAFSCDSGFGNSVALSGNTAVVTAPRLDNIVGASFVFVRNGTTWTQQAMLQGNGCTEYAGASVAIDGDTIALGSYTNNTDGSVCVYTRNGAAWSHQVTLHDNNAGIKDAFGNSVALFEDRLLVGAYYHSLGNTTREGKAYLYERLGSAWALHSELQAQSPGVADTFGSWVALSGTTAIVGAPKDDVGTNADQGSVHIFVTPEPLTGLGGACTTDANCTSGFCADGVCCDNPCDNTCMACTAAKKGKGLDGYCGSIAYDTDPDNECWGGACNGQNACRYYNGVPCTASSQCMSKYCVDGFCCNNICMGGCSACSADKKGSGYNGVCGVIAANTNPDGECTDGGTCNGSGACTTAQTKMPNGSACSSATQCQSGYCADGVCCDSWCLGTCKACTAAKKGTGVDGTCGFITDQADPDDECVNGSCNGQGSCKLGAGAYCTLASQCVSGFCVDNVCCDSICDGWCSACSAAKKGQGASGVCESIANGRDPDGECNPGECNGSGACSINQALLPAGSACIAAAQCASGFCVDGYCCDTACSGACQACSASKKGSGANGSCGSIAYDTDPDEECWGGSCSGAGACKYYNGVPCTTTTECLSNYCVDGFCCGNVCTLPCMACSTAKKGSGYDGVCGMIASGNDPDDECVGGACDGAGVCVATLAPDGQQ